MIHDLLLVAIAVIINAIVTRYLIIPAYTLAEVKKAVTFLEDEPPLSVDMTKERLKHLAGVTSNEKPIDIEARKEQALKQKKAIAEVIKKTDAGDFVNPYDLAETSQELQEINKGSQQNRKVNSTKIVPTPPGSAQPPRKV